MESKKPVDAVVGRRVYLEESLNERIAQVDQLEKDLREAKRSERALRAELASLKKAP